MGRILSSALTSFVYVPNPALVSYTMHLLFGETFVYLDEQTGLFYSPFDPAAANLMNSRESGFKRTPIVRMKLGGSGLFRNLHEVCGLEVPTTSTTDSLDPALGSASVKQLRDHIQGLSLIANHPQLPYRHFQSEWLLETARAHSGATALLISPLTVNDHAAHYSGRRGGVPTVPVFYDFPMIRCDIVNMTRHVHHHYDYAKDGHSRTYTMRITVNVSETHRVTSHEGIIDPSRAISHVDQNGVHLSLLDNTAGASHLSKALVPSSNTDKKVDLELGHHPCQHQIVSVRLYRDRDGFPIPYTSIYGVTLITALRLGLHPALRERLFHSFLRLPLYEDMAPWNIVLMGQVRHIILFPAILRLSPHLHLFQ
jgi:hypothetical protein